MIDFRYHLVSIVAIFLALAIGIVVGATALKPKAQEILDRESRVERQQIIQAHAKIGDLQHQLSSEQAAAQAFAQAAAPRLLDNLLSGERVALVTTPGADGSVISGVTAALRLAGAKVTTQAQLQPAFFSTSAATESHLSSLAQQVAPPGVIPSAPTAQLAGQQEAAQVIAAALVTKNADLPAAEASLILTGFTNQGFLQLSPSQGATPPPQATLAVVVSPASPPSTSDTDPANMVLLAMAGQLNQASKGVVLAGSVAGSGAGSAIDELVAGGTGLRLSSVDNADTMTGQIVVAWALSYLLAKHPAAAYGVNGGAVPSPAPTPSPTPTPTPTPSATIKSHG